MYVSYLSSIRACSRVYIDCPGQSPLGFAIARYTSAYPELCLRCFYRLMRAYLAPALWATPSVRAIALFIASSLTGPRFPFRVTYPFPYGIVTSPVLSPTDNRLSVGTFATTRVHVTGPTKIGSQLIHNGTGWRTPTIHLGTLTYSQLPLKTCSRCIL